MRVMVTGGRDYGDAQRVFEALDAIHQHRGPITCVMQGGAAGADAFARTWADLSGVDLISFQPDWKKRGRRAGPERNREMVQVGKPDLVLAFPGRNGTANAIDEGRRAGIEVIDLADPTASVMT
jgi:hypothetical protein